MDKYEMFYNWLDKLDITEEDLPFEIKTVGKSYLTLANGIKVTRADLATHYALEANSMRTFRSIGPLCGDWRAMRDIAEVLHSWFKFADIKGYRREYNRYSQLIKPQW